MNLSVGKCTNAPDEIIADLMVSLATPILEDLSRQSGESSHFSVRSGDKVIVIARTTGPGTFQYVDRVGVSRPLHATALGKVLLAALRPDQLEHFLEHADLQALTPKTIVDIDRLSREIDDVRASGVAFDDGEFETELRCVAVPVRDFSGQLIGAIGISGPMWRLTIQLLQGRAVELVQMAARQLSTEFGFGGVRRVVAAE